MVLSERQEVGMLVYPSPIPSLVEGNGEKTQKTLISKVRGDQLVHSRSRAQCPLIPAGSAISTVQLKHRMLLLTRQLLENHCGGPPQGEGLLSPPLGDEVTAGAPQASPFPVEILAPWGTQMYSSPSRVNSPCRAGAGVGDGGRGDKSRRKGVSKLGEDAW